MAAGRSQVAQYADTKNQLCLKDVTPGSLTIEIRVRTQPRKHKEQYSLRAGKPYNLLSKLAHF